MRRLSAGLLLVLLAAPVLANGQAGPAAGAPPGTEAPGGIPTLAESTARIAVLLEELLKRQEADLLMKRIQIATRGLTELERRVADARDALESLERDRTRISDEIDRISAAGDDESLPDEAEVREHMKQNLERELKYINDRLLVFESRLIDRENDLADRLEDLAAWEELVDKALGLK